MTKGTPRAAVPFSEWRRLDRRASTGEGADEVQAPRRRGRVERRLDLRNGGALLGGEALGGPAGPAGRMVNAWNQRHPEQSLAPEAVAEPDSTPLDFTP